MRNLRSLVRDFVPSYRRTTRRTWRSALLAISVLVIAAAAAVPALAGRGHAAAAGGHARPKLHKQAPTGSAYARLVRLRRLDRKPARGTHSRFARLPGHEVSKLRTTKSRTFAAPDGTYVTRTYPVPVNFRDGRGRFQPIDNKLVPVGAAGHAHGFAFENAANAYKSFLPENLGSPVLVSAHGSWVSFRTVGADAGASASGSTGTYSGALPGVDAAYMATNDSLKETLTLADANARSSFDYLVHASRDLRPRRLRNGSIAFANRHGRVIYALPAPFVYDKAQHADKASYDAVSQRLTRTHDGWRLRIAVKRSWLDAKSRQFPVTVDPTISYIENTADTRLHQSGANLDCYVRDGDGANNNLCGGTQILVGWDGLTQRRSMLRFDVQNSLPKGIHILDAELGLYLLDTDNASSATVNLNRITRSGWTGGATWNKYDGTNAWTTAGGDFDSTVAASNTVTDTVGWFKWFPRQLVQGWIDGSIQNNGVVVKEATERSINNRFYFNSSQAPFTQLPYLDVVYEPQTGQRPYYKFEGDRLTDRLSLNVNVASGNLMLNENDLKIGGTGLDLGVQRFYNSQLEKETDLGHEGWTMSSGADVKLRITSSEAVFYAPSGYVVSFQKSGSTFSAPKGIDATLCTVNGTTCKGQSTYALTFSHSQIRNNFDSSGKLVSQRDQNDNQISFSYDTGGHLTQITDTQGRVLTVTSNAAGLITQLTDVTGRTWKYGYDGSNHLISYTDPTNQVTDYVYGASNGLISQVWDNRGAETIITYDTTFSRRVTRIERVNDVGPNKVVTFAYSSPSSPCQSSDFGKTVVTNANGNNTTYCYDDQGKVQTVFDAKGKKQKVSYTSNFFLNTYTSANNATSGFNTTFDINSTSNSINSITQATGSSVGDPNVKSSFTYNTAGGNSFSPFYPATSKNTQGNSQTYTYDTRGNMTSKKDDASTNHVDATYDPAHPGRLTKITDANGNDTQYGYDTQGNLTSIQPPTLAAGTGTQPGNTAIAYDAISRPCVLTDGKGQKTKNGYDGLDRTTSITKYNAGATSSGCTVTGTVAASVTLTYDVNGNLTQRVDPTGTSTFSYSKLNRLISQAFPGGRTNSYTYDQVGNLKTIADAGGTVTYAYDVDNLLASVADPGGSCTTTPKTLCTTFGVDDDGNRTTTTYPNGVVLTSDYDAAGRLTCTMATNGPATPTPPTSKNPCSDQETPNPIRRFVYNYLDSSDESNVHETALRQSVRDEAGNVTSYTYDSVDRLKTATTKNSGGTVTDDYTYTYDAAGNMTKRVAKANGGSTTTTTYTYNKANELCWSFTGTSSNTCATKPTGGVSYTYDANGNQTGASSGRAYSYNVFDQTVSLTPPLGGTAQTASYRGPNQSEIVTRGSDQYAHNVLGIGVKVYSDATVSYFTRDENGALVSERAPGGARYYFVPDGLGSTIATTGSTGAIVNSYKYDPYGGVVTENETSVRPTSFRFAGGLYTSSLGLHKYGQRWYDQTLNRWTQQDSIDQTGDLKQGNRYLYVGDNPVNGTDPSGRSIFTDVGNFIGDQASAAYDTASSAVSSVGNFISSNAQTLFATGAHVTYLFVSADLTVDACVAQPELCPAAMSLSITLDKFAESTGIFEHSALEFAKP
jgi:RHS repeat-associated protein